MYNVEDINMNNFKHEIWEDARQAYIPDNENLEVLEIVHQYRCTKNRFVIKTWDGAEWFFKCHGVVVVLHYDAICCKWHFSSIVTPEWRGFWGYQENPFDLKAVKRYMEEVYIPQQIKEGIQTRIVPIEEGDILMEDIFLKL